MEVPPFDQRKQKKALPNTTFDRDDGCRGTTLLIASTGDRFISG